MAKRKRAPQKKTTREMKRKPVVRDSKVLQPQFVDFSTMVLGPDVVIHNMFQTEIPVGDLTGSEIESVLIARFIYARDFFKALTALLLRQYIAFEANRDKKDEAIAWLKQLLLQAENGTEQPSPAAAN
jgi:hypothetical protein